MEARETTYTETLSIVGNYIARDRSGFADIPIIVSVVAFTALAGLAVSTFCLVRGIIVLSKEFIDFLMWAQRQIEEAKAKEGTTSLSRKRRRSRRPRQPRQFVSSADADE